MDEIKIIDFPDDSSALGNLGSNYNNIFNNSTSNNDYSSIFDEYYKFIRDNTNYNNAWSAEQAQKQMDFQSAQAELERKYGSAEAAKNRDWQEYLSNTAHQREVADLKAAGLNPVLSAMGGNGAAVTSGAAASRTGASSGAKGDADQSANNALVSMLSGFLSSMVSLENQRVSAEASLAVADKYNAMSQIIEQMQESYKTFEHENYPSNMYQAISAIVNRMFDYDPFGGIADAFNSLADTVSGLFNKGQKNDNLGTGSLWHSGEDFSGSSGKFGTAGRGGKFSEVSARLRK